jgi:hypothetical protein
LVSLIEKRLHIVDPVRSGTFQKKHLGREIRGFPVTLYREQWEKLLGTADEIRNFILDNDSALKKKE